MSKIKLSNLIFLILFASLFFMESCSTVPLTGRSQINLLPESNMVDMSLTSYNQFLDSNKVSTNQQQIALVKRVSGKIASAVEKYLKENGYESYLQYFNWEFNLVDNDTPNAWCMPGGKVVVYTGILPITKNEAGLAVVLGHEIAHAVARHGNERMSQEMLVQMGGMALSEAMKEKPKKTQTIFSTAYGIGSQVGVMLPFSRQHEYEADKMGLIFMSIAGYDPHEAITFWQRMSQIGGQKPPEFLSTHPVDSKRIAALTAMLPEAMKYYEGKK